MLAILSEIPKTKEHWDRWSLNHRTSHEAIIAKLTALGRPVPYYLVEPINWQAPDLFLQANSQLHIDAANALGQQSADLQDVDLRDERQLVAWIDIHDRQHRDFETALGL